MDTRNNSKNFVLGQGELFHNLNIHIDQIEEDAKTIYVYPKWGDVPTDAARAHHHETIINGMYFGGLSGYMLTIMEALLGRGDTNFFKTAIVSGFDPSKLIILGLDEDGRASMPIQLRANVVAGGMGMRHSTSIRLGSEERGGWSVFRWAIHWLASPPNTGPRTSPAMLRHLLDVGTDPNLMDAFGNTPLHILGYYIAHHPERKDQLKKFFESISGT